MKIKLYDSELKVMDVLWKEGDKSAKELAAELAKQVGWSKTTTYTVIKKCIDKNAIIRTDPGFVCRAAVTKDETREMETEELIKKLYDGSADHLIASLLGKKSMSSPEIAKLRRYVQEMEEPK